MKSRHNKSSSSQVLAAGGVVHRGSRSPMIAVVQRRKDNAWVLPKGKLKAKESLVSAARREATEETGHRVVVREYLGAISYESSGKSKVVQFWRMTSDDTTARKPMDDIKAVKWLRVEDAIALLQQPLERAFLMQIAPRLRQPSRNGDAAARLRASKFRPSSTDKRPLVLTSATLSESARKPNFFARLIGRLA